jgi:hypothetical protein
MLSTTVTLFIECTMTLLTHSMWVLVIMILIAEKNFHKFWWDQDMNLLKAASIKSNHLWKSAGKPVHGLVFDKISYPVYSIEIKSVKIKDFLKPLTLM